MQTIQELITQLTQNRSEQIYEEILTSLKQQETIWAAFSPVTRNCFLGLEHGEHAAYIFTEKTYFDKFQEDMLQKNINVTAVENKQRNRMLLFADFLRCGITAVIIDSGQNFLGISLMALLPESDPDAEKQQIVMNPQLHGTMLYLNQQISCRRADTYDELAMLREIYRGTYLLPIVQQEGKGILPVQQRDGKKLLMLFTDWPEFRRYDRTNACKAQTVRFADMKALCQKADGIVLNPFGANVVLDQELLHAAEQAAMGTLPLPTEKIVMNDGGTQISITAPTQEADAMIDAVAAILKEKKEVNAAYLRMITSDRHMRPNYLFILDANGNETSLYQEIGAAAMPHAGGLDLEFLSYREPAAKEAVGSVKPFYRRKRFLFF